MENSTLPEELTENNQASNLPGLNNSRSESHLSEAVDHPQNTQKAGKFENLIINRELSTSGQRVVGDFREKGNTRGREENRVKRTLWNRTLSEVRDRRQLRRISEEGDNQSVASGGRTNSLQNLNNFFGESSQNQPGREHSASTPELNFNPNLNTSTVIRPETDKQTRNNNRARSLLRQFEEVSGDRFNNSEENSVQAFHRFIRGHAAIENSFARRLDELNFSNTFLNNPRIAVTGTQTTPNRTSEQEAVIRWLISPNSSSIIGEPNAYENIVENNHIPQTTAAPSVQNLETPFGLISQGITTPSVTYSQNIAGPSGQISQNPAALPAEINVSAHIAQISIPENVSGILNIPNPPLEIEQVNQAEEIVVANGNQNIEIVNLEEEIDLNLPANQMALQTQRLVRSAVQSLPAPSNAPADVIRFLDIAQIENANFNNEFITYPGLRSIFIQALTSKLQGPSYSIVARARPTTFEEFRKALLVGCSIIRPRQVIEARASATIQLPNETPLTFFYRMEDLIKEYDFAIEMEDLPAPQREERKRRFREEMLTWLPSALNPPLSASARARNFNSLDEFKTFLQGEKDLEERRAYSQNSSARTANMFEVPSAQTFNTHWSQPNVSDKPAFSDAWHIGTSTNMQSAYWKNPYEALGGHALGGRSEADFTVQAVKGLRNEIEKLRSGLNKQKELMELRERQRGANMERFRREIGNDMRKIVEREFRNFAPHPQNSAMRPQNPQRRYEDAPRGNGGQGNYNHNERFEHRNNSNFHNGQQQARQNQNFQNSSDRAAIPRYYDPKMPKNQ